MRYVNNRDTAQDVLQDGFIKIYTKIGTYSANGSFAGWMRRIFVNTALEYLRDKNSLNNNFSIEESDYLRIENSDYSVLEKLSADELLSCIAQLPNGFRTVFNLFAIEGYTHQEIAKMLNIQESTSRSQFVRARKLLQEKVMLLISKDNVRQAK
jgi:RNA polymerase sigma-70 factor (ECF subfamily)